MQFPSSNKAIAGILFTAAALTGLAYLAAGKPASVSNTKTGSDEEEVKVNFGLREMQGQFDRVNESALEKIQEAWDKQNG